MRTCIDCQFLVKTHVLDNGQAHTYNWDENEKAHKAILEDRWVAECHKGVWTKRLDPMLVVKTTVEENRRKCPFFMSFQKSMLLATAVEQREIVRQNRRNMAAITAILISAVIGGVIGGLIGR